MDNESDIQNQIAALQAQLDKLSSDFYAQNFPSSQTFTKASVFTTSLRVPVYSTTPAVCEVGQIISVAGVLYICTVANTTWTKVGSQ